MFLLPALVFSVRKHRILHIFGIESGPRITNYKRDETDVQLKKWVS